MSRTDYRRDSEAATDSEAARDSVAANDLEGVSDVKSSADDEGSAPSDSMGDATAENCSAPQQTVVSIRAFMACLKPFIELMGYEATDNSSAAQAKWEYFVGSNPAGSIYSAQGATQMHVVGHYLGGDKELVTKFLQTQNVTAPVILECFIP